jgi:hypothetical protein
MTYKETLFFIAKCLTINHLLNNKIIIEDHLKSGNIDWDAIVKLSTDHLVFPALYCNLKKANFLNYLPKDLVEYMKYITNLNRERNEQIIEQAKEINELLLANNITPVFLKGTAYLLENLYDDISERMIGDIDIIIDENNINMADQTLKKNGYSSSYVLYDDHRHLPRLIKEKKIAAIEIHKNFLEKPFRNNFGYKHIKQNIKIIDEKISILGEIDSLTLNILSQQINDNVQKTGNISLRNYYDYFLKKKKTDVVQIIDSYKTYEEIINSYDFVYTKIFGVHIDKLKENSKSTKKYYQKNLENLENLERKKRFKILYKFKSYISYRLPIVLKAFYNKNNFNFVFSRITSKEWYIKTFFKANK